jgi:hypothetical protein
MNAIRVARALLVSCATLVAGCQDAGRSAATNEIRLAPSSALTDEIRAAPTAVVEAYRFAIANRELLDRIPCHCGCGAMGHRSNAACYLAPDRGDGTIAFDTHALGCTICVDITQDVMRLQREGRTLAEMQAYVAQTYARYGPSNIP